MARRTPVTLYTFGDSILDSGRYNERGHTPGALIIRNDDALFPEFRGNDLASRGYDVRLEHRAVDGSTVDSLPGQATRLELRSPAVALLTIGGNDLIAGLMVGDGTGVQRFAGALDAFLEGLLIRPVLIGTVYDPSFGDDTRNFTGVDPALARANLGRVNEVLRDAAARHGVLVDLHAHFLRGDPSWYAQTIEPSLTGVSEVRRAFLPAVAKALET
jgi:lysophospholipase L1-like esterase